MVRNVLKISKRVAPAVWAGLFAALGVACGSSTTPEGDCVDPDSQGTVADGKCCVFSINCAAGSICNTADEDLYDAAKEANVCVKVICQSDGDCDGDKKCSLEKICKPPVCQNDASCPGSTVCRNGTCEQPPGTADVVTCEVLSRNTAIRQGRTIELEAISRNENGAPLTGIPYEWTSSNANVVAVSGGVATGGTEQGIATLTAKPMGTTISCERDVRITNFPNVPAGRARVVLVADDDGSPVANAQVVLRAGPGTLTATTGPEGAAMFDVAGAVESVTVIKAGWQYVSILQPGTNDIFLPLPRKPNESVAGGFRGVVDLSATKKADIQLGLAGPAIPSNLLDFGLESLIGDFVPTEINAPELGLEDTFDLPGGLLLGLGNKKFTSDGAGVRCQGVTPGAGQLGCFLARAPKGQSAGWALAGQLKLSQVTSIANELSGAFGGTGEDLPIGEILTAVLPLLRTLNHAINASVFVEESPKVLAPGSDATGCTDPTIPNYEDKCWADFAKYRRADMAASQSLNVLSKVTVPTLPMLPDGTRCTGAAVLLAGTALSGRGLVPLGVTAGLDALDDTQTPDCRIAGVDKPFGDQSPKLPDGQMPLSMAAPHSGAEGSQIFMLLIAIDPDNIASSTGGGFQLSALVRRVDSVQPEQTISGNFLAFPAGTVNKSGGSVAFTSSLQGATLSRIELQRGGDTWLIYAPSTMTTLALPNVPQTRSILSAVGDAFMLTMSMGGAYSTVWEFGSGNTLDHLFETVDAFVVQECTNTAGSPCTIVD